MQKEDSNNYKEDVKQIDLKLKNRDQEVDFGNPENEEEEDEKQDESNQQDPIDPSEFNSNTLQNFKIELKPQLVHNNSSFISKPNSAMATP